MTWAKGGGSGVPGPDDTPQTIPIDRYTVTRRHQPAPGESDDKSTKLGRETEKLAQQGKDLMDLLPTRQSSWEEKREFSLKISQFLSQCDLSPRFLQSQKKYCAMRQGHTADADHKKEILQRHADKSHQESCAQQEERDKWEAELAKAKVAETSRKRGRQNLTEEEKARKDEERREKARKRYHNKKKQRQSKESQ